MLGSESQAITRAASFGEFFSISHPLGQSGEVHSLNAGDVFAQRVGLGAGAELSGQLSLCTKFSREPPRIRFLQASSLGVLVLPTPKYPLKGKGRGGRHLASWGRAGEAAPATAVSYARPSRATLARLPGLAPPAGSKAETRASAAGEEAAAWPASVGSQPLTPPPPVPAAMDLYCFKNTRAPGLLFLSLSIKLAKSFFLQ